MCGKACVPNDANSKTLNTMINRHLHQTESAAVRFPDGCGFLNSGAPNGWFPLGCPVPPTSLSNLMPHTAALRDGLIQALVGSTRTHSGGVRGSNR